LKALFDLAESKGKFIYELRLFSGRYIFDNVLTLDEIYYWAAYRLVQSAEWEGVKNWREYSYDELVRQIERTRAKREKTT